GGLEVILDHDAPLARRSFSAAAGATAASGCLSAVGGDSSWIASTIHIGTASTAGTIVGASGSRGQDEEARRREACQEASAHPDTPSNRWRSRAEDTFHTPSTRVSSACTLWVLTSSFTTSPVSRRTMTPSETTHSWRTARSPSIS